MFDYYKLRLLQQGFSRYWHICPKFAVLTKENFKAKYTGMWKGARSLTEYSDSECSLVDEGLAGTILRL